MVTIENTSITGLVNLISSPCTIQNFFDIESLGIECRSPRCCSCRCGKCSIGGEEYMIREERELALIEGNIKFCGNHWLAVYPWLRSSTKLPDNYYQIFNCFKQIKRRMKKYFADKYCNQIDDILPEMLLGS